LGADPESRSVDLISGFARFTRAPHLASLNVRSEIFRRFRWNYAGHLMFFSYPTGGEATS
jgi:hypothetical protein